MMPIGVNTTIPQTGGNREEKNADSTCGRSVPAVYSGTLDNQLLTTTKTMNSKLIAGIIALVLFVGGAFTVGGMYFSYNRAEVTARNACEAQLGDVENVLDNMWKSFQEIGGLADRERETAMELFVEYAEARTPEGGGKLMTWITEQAPTIDSGMYKDLQARLVAGRQEFRNSQTRMLELVRVHENVIEDPFRGFFIRNDEPIAFNVIASAETEQAVLTGRDERTFQLPARD